jgi:hypothetical protein
MIQVRLFCLTSMHHLFTIPVGVYCNNYYQFLLFTFSFGINVKWNLLYVFLLLKAGCFLRNMHFLVLLKTALQYVLHMSEWFEVKCYQVWHTLPHPLDQGLLIHMTGLDYTIWLLLWSWKFLSTSERQWNSPAFTIS